VAQAQALRGQGGGHGPLVVDGDHGVEGGHVVVGDDHLRRHHGVVERQLQ
jgi:hypothetical protein